MQLYRLSIHEEFCIFEVYLASCFVCYTWGLQLNVFPSITDLLMLLRLHCIALQCDFEDTNSIPSDETYV